MKKLFVLLVCFMVTIHVQAQSDKYNAAMQKNLSAVDTAFKNPPSLLVLANNFERIGRAEKNQWLPYYYAALYRVNYTFIIQQAKENDEQADKIDALLAIADSISPNNSEITLLKAMSSTLRMLVDPMSRYMSEGMKSESLIQQAILQDPNNPRPYYYKGNMLKNTPEQYGGGCAKAMDYFLKAKERFAAFKPAGEFYPIWGAQLNTQAIEQCN